MCKVSVIVPVYNAANYLENTLKNITEQTLQDIEIICVDDGSKDNSEVIIKEYQKKDARIKYEYQKNKGAGIARNRGISIAQGKFVAFMDADDNYSSKSALEILFNTAINNGALICGGSVNGVDAKEKRVFETEGFVDFSDYQFDFLFGRFIYDRKFLVKNKIEFPNLRVYEDPLFLVNAMISAKRFYAVKEGIYYYSGPHQVNTLSAEKINHYLQGIIEELKLSSQFQLAKLHKVIVERLEREVSFYAAKYLYENDEQIFYRLMQANIAIDRELIGLDWDYTLPVLKELLKTGVKYMKIRNAKFVKWILHLLNR